MLDRRRFLAVAAGAAGSALGLSGCRAADVLGLGPAVRIAVSWSATELQAFRAVLDGLQHLGYSIELIPLGDDIETAIGPTGNRYGRRPDIVLLPRLGLPRENPERLRLEAVDSDLKIEHWLPPSIWAPLLRRQDPEGHGRWYGVPFKVAHKSTVWYRQDVFDQYGLEHPTTWRAWLELNKRLAAAPVPFPPLALGAADGWVLTDFFENVLLGSAPEVYHQLETGVPGLWAGEEVHRAFRLLGRMWAAEGTLAGGLNRSRVQQFPDAVVEVFGHRHAAMVVSADYAELVIRRFGTDPGTVRAFTFPTIDGDEYDTVPEPAQPLLVGADVAVLAESPSPEARQLLAKLAAPEAPLRWIENYGGFLAANPATPDRCYSPVLTDLHDDLTRPDLKVAFDLSDQLGPLGGSDGLWRVLQDLLTRVVTGGLGAVQEAANLACGAMSQLEQQLPRPPGGV